jgi:hypothetical protein
VTRQISVPLELGYIGHQFGDGLVINIESSCLCVTGQCSDLDQRPYPRRMLKDAHAVKLSFHFVLQKNSGWHIGSWIGIQRSQLNLKIAEQPFKDALVDIPGGNPVGESRGWSQHISKKGKKYFRSAVLLRLRDVLGNHDCRIANHSGNNDLCPSRPVDLAKPFADWLVTDDSAGHNNARHKCQDGHHRPISISPSWLHRFPLSMRRILPLGVAA